MENLIPVESPIVKSREHPESFLIQDQQVKFSLNRHAVGAGRASSHSLTLNVQPASYAMEGNKSTMMGAQYESSLFSSSLSDLFNRKCNCKSPFCFTVCIIAHGSLLVPAVIRNFRPSNTTGFIDF